MRGCVCVCAWMRARVRACIGAYWCVKRQLILTFINKSERLMSATDFYFNIRETLDNCNH